MKKINYIKAKYFDKRTFECGSEEEVYNAGLDKVDCIVISKKNWDYIQEQLYRLESLEN